MVQIPSINVITKPNNMGKLIKVIFPNPKEYERKQNVKQLKILIDRYILDKRNFIINKIKDEQRTAI